MVSRASDAQTADSGSTTAGTAAVAPIARAQRQLSTRPSDPRRRPADDRVRLDVAGDHRARRRPPASEPIGHALEDDARRSRPTPGRRARTGAADGRSTPSTVMAWKSWSRIWQSQDRVQSAPIRTESATSSLRQPVDVRPVPDHQFAAVDDDADPALQRHDPVAAEPGRRRGPGSPRCPSLLVRPKSPSPTRSEPPSATSIRSRPSSTVRDPSQIGCPCTSG